MPSQSKQSEPQEARRRGRRVRRTIAGLAAVVVLLGVVAAVTGCMHGRRRLREELEQRPRHPETGVLPGAEARDYAPAADAPSSGAAVLLLHGYLGCRRDFNDLPERLAARGFHVRAARLPGHGTTPLELEQQTPDTMIEGARAELARLHERFEDVYVVGFSMGGTLGTLLAAEGGVEGLVLVAPYYAIRYHWWYVLPVETWHGMLGWTVPYFPRRRMFIQVNREEAKDEILSYWVAPSKSARMLIRLARRGRRPEVLERVTCPVLMLVTDGDEAASPGRARKAYATMQPGRGELVTMPERNNHHLLWDYDREDAIGRIEAFLRDEQRAAAGGGGGD